MIGYRLRHPKRRLSSPEPPAESEMHTPAPKRVRSSSAVNGHSSKSPPDEEEVPEEGAICYCISVFYKFVVDLHSMRLFCVAY